MQKAAFRSRKAILPLLARFYTTQPRKWQPLPHLPDPSLSTFKSLAFTPSQPYVFPHSTFASLPAIEKWFTPIPSPLNTLTLNQEYLKPHGNTLLTLEYTHHSPSQPLQFHRGNAPLSLFLAYASLSLSEKSPTAQNSRIYIAQSSLATLPPSLKDDLPTPEYVIQAGKGDLYDSSLWMGMPPTYTPLHKDPNHNVFVQLAGRKVVRLMEPEMGSRVLESVRRMVGESGGGGGGRDDAIRGEEMMVGKEREMLEEVVWGKGGGANVDGGWEVEVGSGDGVFIPSGWWHSVKGIGDGLTGSVNWWFR